MATRTDLGKIIFTNGKEYDPNVVYPEKTFVLYRGSTYLSLRTVAGVEPVNDYVNWQLMAKGFADEDFTVTYYLYGSKKDKEDEIDDEGNVIYVGTPQIDADSLGGNLPEYYAPQHEITDAFSESKDYAVGDYCIYLNNLYRFTQSKSSGLFDGTKVVPVTISSELQRLTGGVDSINSNLGSGFFVNMRIALNMSASDTSLENQIKEVLHFCKEGIQYHIIVVFEKGGSSYNVTYRAVSDDYGCGIIFGHAIGLFALSGGLDSEITTTKIVNF